MYEPFRTAAGSGRFLIPPPADAVVCTLHAGILIAHQIVNSRRKFRFQCTLITSGIVFHAPTTKMIPRSAGLSPPYRISKAHLTADYGKTPFPNPASEPSVDGAVGIDPS